MNTAEDWYRLTGLLAISALFVYGLWLLLPTEPREKR